MLKLAEGVKKYINFKAKTIVIDNLTFKLHYRLTVWILAISVVLVCSQEYIGEHIRCIHSDPSDDKKKLEHVIDRFCFFTGTFTVVKHLNRSVMNREIAHPGVGPSDGDEETIHHAYYQWVPFVLFFQALCFYIPHLVWREKEGKRIKSLVEGFTEMDMMDAEKKDKQLEKVQQQFSGRMWVYRSWAFYLVFSELLNLANLIFQVWLTDVFLGGQFLDLGPKVYTDYSEDDFNPLDVVFPKVTKCTFRKFGPSGSLQFHDVMCVMALNIINEKIYITLWFWYVILLPLTVLALLWRFISFIFHSSAKFNVFTFRFAAQTKLDPRDLLTVARHHTYGEWLFFVYLAKNMNGRLFKDLLTNMADQLRRDGEDYKTKKLKNISRSSSTEDIQKEFPKENSHAVESSRNSSPLIDLTNGRSSPDSN